MSAALPRPAILTAALCTLALCAAATAAAAAEPYPFEGTWVRSENACTPTTVRARTYTAREVISPLGRCTIRRVTAASGTFELLEECRRSDRTQSVTELLRLPGPDSLVLRRQVSRLKIPRQIHFSRCTVAAGPAGASGPPPRATRPGPFQPKARSGQP